MQVSSWQYTWPKKTEGKQQLQGVLDRLICCKHCLNKCLLLGICPFVHYKRLMQPLLIHASAHNMARQGTAGQGSASWCQSDQAFSLCCTETIPEHPQRSRPCSVSRVKEDGFMSQLLNHWRTLQLSIIINKWCLILAKAPPTCKQPWPRLLFQTST